MYEKYKRSCKDEIEIIKFLWHQLLNMGFADSQLIQDTVKVSTYISKYLLKSETNEFRFDTVIGSRITYRNLTLDQLDNFTHNDPKDLSLKPTPAVAV